MPRPPAQQLQAHIPCPPQLDHVSALCECEAAAGECGFRVASRSKRHLLLMPWRRPNLLSCVAPNFVPAAPAADFAGGQGIAVELAPVGEGSGLEVSVATSRAPCSEAFVSKLSSRLENFGNEEIGEAIGSTAPIAATGSPRKEHGAFRSKDTMNEAQAYYRCSKLLCDSRQPAGRQAAELAAQVVQRCGAGLEQDDDTVSSCEGAMVQCVDAVQQLCRLVAEAEGAEGTGAGECDGSGGSRERYYGAVERCFFARVGMPLWHSYERRYAEDDALFVQKSRALAVVNNVAVWDALGVRATFRGPAGAAQAFSADEAALVAVANRERSRAEASDRSLRTCSTAAATEECMSPAESSGSAWQGPVACPLLTAMAPDAGPYERAAAALKGVEAALRSGRGFTPREAVEALALAQLEMKTCALGASGGQAELYAMDDVMPVFVFVLARAGLSRPFACAAFAGDALTHDQRLDAEGRAVLLLDAAARHITFDWDFADLVGACPGPLCACSPMDFKKPAAAG